MVDAGLAVDSVTAMEVAVGEALSNCYRHAYASGSGPVSVDVITTVDGLTVVVRDKGSATVAPAIPSVLPSRTASGGRGLYMVCQLADDVQIDVNESGHGITVRMTARLGPVGARA